MITSDLPRKLRPRHARSRRRDHRASQIFDRVVVGVVANPQHKSPLFALEERVDFLKEALDLDNVEVDVFPSSSSSSRGAGTRRRL